MYSIGYLQIGLSWSVVRPSSRFPSFTLTEKKVKYHIVEFGITEVKLAHYSDKKNELFTNQL